MRNFEELQVEKIVSTANFGRGAIAAFTKIFKSQGAYFKIDFFPVYFIIFIDKY